ncbi:hypothetical protein C8Q78DRAFT_142803 [Trametes maxima]|nr:hypothetical protein C8Q78DRAFT_142803 [Trametes maxima]
MFFGLYIHPRPVVTYGPPTTRRSTAGAGAPQTTADVDDQYPRMAKEAAVQEPLDREPRGANAGRFDDRWGTSTTPAQEPYYTENVVEALRRKQRMKARQALEFVATSRSPPSLRPPELVPPSPSSSCASSPPNSPLLSPTPMHLAEQPSQANVFLESRAPRGRQLSPRKSPGGHEIRPFPLSLPRTARLSGGVELGPRRPSRSRSSIIRHSLSRHSSKSSMVSCSPAPVTTTANTAAIMDFVKRLAPLPRFNPYRRTRAESTSSVVDLHRQETGGVFCGLLPRRRCRSEPTPARKQRA